MKKLVCSLVCFTAMMLNVQAGTITEKDPIGTPAVAGTAVIIEISAGILHAGLSSANAPTVVLSQSFAPEGIIKDFSGFENALTQVYSQLGVSSSRYPVIITRTALQLKSVTENTVTTLFNKFNVPSLYMVYNGEAALYAAERPNSVGIVLHSVNDISYIVPIYSYVLPHAVTHLDMEAHGGLDGYMRTLLKNKGHNVSLQQARDILYTTGYIAADYNAELQRSKASVATSYNLNGRTISIGKERFKAPEALFQPSMINMQSPGVHETIYNSIMNCDVDSRKELYANIVLSGNTTLFPGFKDRLREGIAKLAPTNMNVVVKAPANREYLPWTGAKALVPLLTSQFWLTKTEFATQGATIVHKKFY